MYYWLEAYLVRVLSKIECSSCLYTMPHVCFHPLWDHQTNVALVLQIVMIHMKLTERVVILKVACGSPTVGSLYQCRAGLTHHNDL